jgi:hypothetical protein
MRRLIFSAGALLVLAGCVTANRDSQDREWAAKITDAGCPQARNFPDVAGAKLPPAQQKPFLRAGCTSDHLIVQSNGIPNFEFIPVTPNPLGA